MKRGVTWMLWAAVLTQAPVQPAAAQVPSLTTERIASFPYLSGTAPSNPVWSPDGSRVAFLWNDQAMPFRDLWVVSASGGAPRQITDMARDFPFPDDVDRDPNVALAQRVRARARTGLAWIAPCCATFQPRDVPAWTPDGQALVVTYRGALFRVKADGTGVTRLTEPAGEKYAVAFSPDGTFLSFLQDGDLWLWNQQSGDLVRATKSAVPNPSTVTDTEFYNAEAGFVSYRWSPDSRQIALNFEDRRQVFKILLPNYLGDDTHVNTIRRENTGDRDIIRVIGIYAVGSVGGRLRDLDLPKTDRLINNYSWSPDGSLLLLDQASVNARDRWIYTVKADAASIREIWHDFRDSRNSQRGISVWQSDGQGIFFLSEEDENYHLYALPLTSRTPKRLTSGDWEIIGENSPASLIVSRATKQVFFISTQKNSYERQVYRMAEAGGPVAQVTSMTGSYFPFVSPDASKIALLHSNDVTPTELYIGDAKGGLERRVTRSPPSDFSTYRWVQPRYVTFKSHVDGATVHGKIFEPPNLDRTKKYAAIMGPVYPNSVRNRWGDREEWRGSYNSLQQYLAVEGQYIVMSVDVRGSVGHGRAFREQLLQYGVIDIDDIQSGVEYLKTLGYVDPGRIGIWGSSYGGLMTLMSVFKKPDLYAAAVASSPASNIWRAGGEAVMGRPNARPEAYRTTSAITFGEDLKAHLMIIHGMQDTSVLFKESVTLAEKLMMLGKDFDFVLSPTSVHAWSRKDYVAVYFLNKLVGHFDRYLGRGPR